MDIIDKLLLLHEKYYSINLVNRQVTKKYRKKVTNDTLGLCSWNVYLSTMATVFCAEIKI